MCGIVGYVNGSGDEPAEAQIVTRMCERIIHRGPDDQGIHIDGPVGIGMRRLSIIDLRTGHQPVHNENKTIWVVLNGEIYNYREVREGLVAKGHDFSTTSDTEVLVHLYEEYGEECVQYLRGMFAFAIWDRNREVLFLARDRMGEKPLYYYTTDSSVVFASELKALLVHPQVKRKLNTRALFGYLQFNYIPEPLSIFDDVQRLLPGHTLTFRRGTISVRQYWDIPKPHGDENRETTCQDELMSKVEEAVRIQLVSDVPLGAFLSGGVDSSTIVALMARVMNRPVKTFSIGFADKRYDELSYAGAVAKHLGTEHHELVVTPASMSLIDTIISSFDEPFGDSSAIPTFHVAKLASEHVKVVLTGDGGDELFAGYERYVTFMRRQWLHKVPEGMRALAFGGVSRLLPKGAPGKRWLHNSGLPARRQYLDSISYFKESDRMGLLDGQVLAESLRMREGETEELMGQWFPQNSYGDMIAQLLYLDAKTYLPGDILTKVDRMTMANSLEARAPFLDHQLVEYVARMPSSMKVKNLETKVALRRLASRILPREILERPKQGFAAPISFWFCGEMIEKLRAVLTDRRAIQRGIFNPKRVSAMLGKYEQGNQYLGNSLWSIFVFELWCQMYCDQSVV